MKCGPWYFVRNLCVGKGGVFKFRVQDRFALINNTFVTWGSIGNRMHHILTSFSRNNLYISADGNAPIWTAHDCNQPQCVFDPYVVDNHWAIKYKNETVRRVFHQPKKYEHNPVIAGEGGHICIFKDEDGGLFRMELTWRRDGFHLDRLLSRPKLIERGPEGTWDDGMVFGSPFWVEVGAR